jgi:ABC-type nickel/cobalt efflux system permease component RcnA
MRRALLAAVAALLLVPGAGAEAHPLGNFTINRLDVVSVSRERVDVRWILDQAEIPTFRERGLTPAQVLDRRRADAARTLRLTVDGRRVPLALRPGGRVAFPPGQGGLPTTRVELRLTAPARAARTVTLRDDGQPGRLGWRAIVVRPGAGTAVRSDVPAEDVTRGLRAYPRDLLDEPPAQRAATLRVRPGDGSVTAPRADGHGLATTADRAPDGGFAGLFADAAAGRGVLALLLLAAVGWGALHALSPGHGKAMVAAYLVGTRGTVRHAVLLGLTVTVTHTIGVFALGTVALALSQWLLPEDLYPWLTLASALMVLGVGVAVLRARRRRTHHHHHHHGDHGPGHHHAPESLRPRALLALGASAGLLPCPSALVVLLAAVAQHEIALGLLLVVAFSAGLAATLTAVGVLVVGASQRLARLPAAGPVVAALPVVSAALIVVVGLVLTMNALPEVVS